MINDSLIYEVIRRKSIVEYLEKRGINPVKSLADGKYQYLCPFPDHKETKPSFMVYTQSSDFDNFYCFGCQRSCNIIHLVSGIENISFHEALKKLSDGIEIGPLDGIDIQLAKMDKTIFQTIFQPKDILDLNETLMSISSLCRNHLSCVNNDSLECDIVDKLYASVDSDIMNCDFDSVTETCNNLSGVLTQRRQLFKKNKLEKMRAMISGCKTE